MAAIYLSQTYVTSIETIHLGPVSGASEPAASHTMVDQTLPVGLMLKALCDITNVWMTMLLPW